MTNVILKSIIMLAKKSISIEQVELGPTKKKILIIAVKLWVHNSFEHRVWILQYRGTERVVNENFI